MFYDGRRPVHSDRRIDHPAMKMVVAWQKAVIRCGSAGVRQKQRLSGRDQTVEVDFAYRSRLARTDP